MAVLLAPGDVQSSVVVVVVVVQFDVLRNKLLCEHNVRKKIEFLSPYSRRSLLAFIVVTLKISRGSLEAVITFGCGAELLRGSFDRLKTLGVAV